MGPFWFGSEDGPGSGLSSGLSPGSGTKPGLSRVCSWFVSLVPAGPSGLDSGLVSGLDSSPVSGVDSGLVLARDSGLDLDSGGPQMKLFLFLQL